MYQEATREPYSFWFIHYLKDRANMFFKRWEERFVLDGEDAQPVNNGGLPVGGGQQAAGGWAHHRVGVQQHQVLQHQPSATCTTPDWARCQPDGTGARPRAPQPVRSPGRPFALGERSKP